MIRFAFKRGWRDLWTRYHHWRHSVILFGVFKRIQEPPITILASVNYISLMAEVWNKTGVHPPNYIDLVADLVVGAQTSHQSDISSRPGVCYVLYNATLGHTSRGFTFHFITFIHSHTCTNTNHECEQSH